MSAYIVKLSDKSEIPIEADEVEKVKVGLKTGQLVQVRQGIFNPSFFICLVLDIERLKAWRADQPQFNSVDKTPKPLKPLADIFNQLKQLK